MKKVVFTLLIALSASVFAVPSVGVADLIYTTEVKTPIKYTQSSHSSSESGYGYSSQSSSIDTQVVSRVEKNMKMFSAAVKGALIKSRQFTVVDAAPTIKTWQSNKKDILSVIQAMDVASVPPVNIPKESSVAIKNAESAPESAVTTNNANDNQPDYILIGYLNNVSAYENRNPIMGTNKTSAIYNIDLSVDYKLVNTKTKQIIAAFTAAGHGGEVKLLNDPDQQVNYNVPKLIKDASDSLASDVMDNLTTQIDFNKLNPKPKVAPMTNVVEYK